MHINRTSEPTGLVPPHLTQYFAASERDTGVLHEIAQKLKLPSEKKYRFAFPGNLPAGDVDADCAKTMNIHRPSKMHPSQETFNAGQHFRNLQWFMDAVIRT